MSRIFTFNSKRNGSYISSVDNAVSVSTNGEFRSMEKGLSWYNDGTAIIDMGTTYTVSRLSGTIEVWFKADIDFEAGDRWLLGYNSGGNSYLGFGATGDLELESNTAADFWLDHDKTNFVPNKWYHLLVVADGGTVKNYLNNVLIETTTPTNDVTFQYIGNYSATNRDFFGHIGQVMLDDQPYTERQRADSFETFLNAGPLGEELYPRFSSEMKASDLSNEIGIVAAYNFKEAGNDTDVSGSGENGVVSGNPMLTVNGKKFNGIVDKELLGDLEDVKTIAFRFKPATTTEQILEGAANDKLIHVNAGTLTYAEYDIAYVDGITTDTIVADQWQNVVITSSTNVDNSAVTLALNNTTYGEFEIEDLRFFSTEWSAEQAADYHSEFAKRVVLNRIPGEYNAISNVPFGMSVQSGAYSTQELVAQDGVLKELDIGTKYILCDSEGLVSVPNTNMPGEIEFYINKGSDASIPFIYPILDRQIDVDDASGYYLSITGGEGMVFQRVDPGANTNLFTTAAFYIAINTWYEIKITRDLSGEFLVKIKGGAFGNQYVAIDVIGGSGDNPVTDSTHNETKYLVLNFDADDKFILKA